MTVKIGDLEFKTLLAQPFGYDGDSVLRGRTYKRWAVAGLLTPAEWITLLNEYDTWRDLRIQDPEPATVDELGNPISIQDQIDQTTTVLFSFQGPSGPDASGTSQSISWTDVKCYFVEAPVGEQIGTFISASFGVADALQSREVELDALEEEAGEELPNFGIFEINGAQIKLTAPPDTYDALPELQLTAAARHYVSGSTAVIRLKQVDGTTTEEGWGLIREWYEATVVATPEVGEYYPVSIPTASAAFAVVNGEKIVQYTVSMALAQVI